MHIIFSATGHTQFKGQRYCPSKFTLSQEEWLAEKKEEAAAVAAAAAAAKSAPES